jgi:asparagine synthase (glutamine-hydrolysing)
MTQGGRDRALARAAFADLVPTEVERRTLKGETTRYFAAILAANRAWIADTLSSGYLANCAIVDSGRLAAIARADWRENSLAADGLYSLIAAEAWLQKLHELKLRTLRDQGAAAA